MARPPASPEPAAIEPCDVCGQEMIAGIDPLWLCYRYFCTEHGPRLLVTFLAVANLDSPYPPSHLSTQGRQTAKAQMAYRARAYIDAAKRVIAERQADGVADGSYYLELPGGTQIDITGDEPW